MSRRNTSINGPSLSRKRDKMLMRVVSSRRLRKRHRDTWTTCSKITTILIVKMSLEVAQSRRGLATRKCQRILLDWQMRKFYSWTTRPSISSSQLRTCGLSAIDQMMERGRMKWERRSRARTESIVGWRRSPSISTGSSTSKSSTNSKYRIASTWFPS